MELFMPCLFHGLNLEVLARLKYSISMDHTYSAKVTRAGVIEACYLIQMMIEYNITSSPGCLHSPTMFQLFVSPIPSSDT